MIAFVVAWVLVYFAIWKGVKSSGKVVYFTAVLPYVFIFAFLIKTVQLPGSSDGLQYFFKPNWELLLSADVSNYVDCDMYLNYLFMSLLYF